MRKRRLDPVSPKRRSRVGNLGIERLAGRDIEARRLEIGERDRWRCQTCGIQCSPNGGDGRPRGEWAHIGAKRRHGDGMDNGRILCGWLPWRPGCHKIEHAYGPSGNKPCPPK